MNYEQAAQKHIEIEAAIDKINAEAKKKVAELRKITDDIENWFALKAQEEGLKNIPTTVGTVYWSHIPSASVANPTEFRDYVIQNAAWDLLETRAAKLAIKSFVEGHGEPPPGVTYASRTVFNLRKTVKE